MSYIQKPPYSSEGSLNIRELTLRVFGGKIAMPYLDFGLLESKRLSIASGFNEATPVALNNPDGFTESGFRAIQTAGEFDGGKFGEGQVYPSKMDGVRMGAVYFMPTSLGGLKLWNEPLVSIQSQKRIIKTVVAGSTRRGTVKELIAAEDYKISIKGVILNERNPEVYPASEVAKLRQLYERRDSVTIENEVCSLCKITRVVISSMTLGADEGYQGMQSYELVCESDNEFEYELLN